MARVSVGKSPVDLYLQTHMQYNDYLSTGSRKVDVEKYPSFAGGKSHIMYTHCFASRFPVLKPLSVRALPRAAQREDELPRQPYDVEND